MLEVPKTPEKPKLGLESLQAVLNFLKASGFQIAVDDLDHAKKYLIDIGQSLPLVRNGIDGIRADYDKRGDELTIWFTNGFGDKDNEQRRLVQNWLEENYSLE